MVENINKKRKKVNVGSIIPKKYVKYLDYIYENKMYKFIKFYYKKYKFLVFRIFTLCVWSLFILTVLNLFSIIEFSIINWFKCMPLYFIIIELSTFIKK